MTSVALSANGWWRRTAETMRGLAGWRRYAALFVLGGIAAAAQAPVHAIPVLLVSFTGLVWILDGSRSRWGAFFAGWWFAFGYFVAGLYWIAHAMLVDPEKFAWMIPFAVGGLSAYLAIYTGLATLVLRLSRIDGVGRILALAVFWMAAEWVRGIALTGFPWNLVGNVWAAVPPVMQLAAVTGAYGLSLFTVFVAATPAVLGDEGRDRWRPVAAAAVLVVAVWIGGAIRLDGATTAMVDGVKLRIVQPNISQQQKWRDETRAANLAKLLRLSGAGGASDATVVIWPETAAPFFVATDPRRRRVMAAAAPEGGYLITGSMRITPRPERPFRIWNSVHAVDRAAAVRATFDKFHLVPFGEYQPFRAVLGFAKLTPGNVDFSRGPGPRTLTLPDLPPFSPLVCYEVIFPGAVTQSGARPAWLLNVTNDAWFGISSGPYQHFAMAQMRAVEEGVPLVRAANTGISGVVDAYGRVVADLGLGREGVVDSALPAALERPTIFARAGNWIALAIGVLAIIGAFLLRSRRST